jgi:hypothetical protein
MSTNYYVESGDFRKCVLAENSTKAVLQALTDISDELNDCSTVPRLETLIRVSPNDFSGEKQVVDNEVEFLDTFDFLRQLEYWDILGCLEREENDEWERTFQRRKEA